MWAERAAVSSRTARAAPGTSMMQDDERESGGPSGAGLGDLKLQPPAGVRAVSSLYRQPWDTRGWKLVETEAGGVFFITALVSCCEWQKPAKLWVTTNAQRYLQEPSCCLLNGEMVSPVRGGERLV